MTGGKIILGTGLVLVLASCAPKGELNVRPTATPVSATQRPLPVRIAEARAQLRLGNAALALEHFRKAEREDPKSVDALAGMAECYGVMGRYDLSHRYLESALALVPGDTALLAALAASLDGAGEREKAAAVRQEIKARFAASEAILLPPGPSVGSSVTVPLTEAAPATPPEATEAAAQAELAARIVEDQPRLERLSMGEIALVTTGRIRWRPLEDRAVARPAAQRQAEQIRLLNAAGVPRLAARTRSWLSGHGWTRLSVGDASAVRERSLVLYPEARQSDGKRIARQLGFVHAMQPRSRSVTVLLGRDAARLVPRKG